MDIQIIADAIRKYGSPAYVLDLNEFHSNYIELLSEYKKVYELFNIAYSFKTNYTPLICKDVLNNGGYAEVVSGMEYDLARIYGFPPERIIVNGPGKWYGLTRMLEDGTNIMLDNEVELDRILSEASHLNHLVRVGFRLNIELMEGKESRFGFDVDDDRFSAIIKKAREASNIKIIGVHFHLSGARSIEMWAERAKKMIYFSTRYFLPNELSIIDLGSGMYGHMNPEFASQFKGKIPTFSDYASAVASIFSEIYDNSPSHNKPLLLVEPGTTLVANVMYYATKVIALKSIRKRNIAVVDGSINQLGEIGRKKRLPLHIIPDKDAEKRIKNVDLTGYTCLEYDILREKIDIPIGINDIIVFENAGAYTSVLTPPFIQGGCKIIAFDKDGSFFLAKREENAKDIMASYYI